MSSQPAGGGDFGSNIDREMSKLKQRESAGSGSPPAGADDAPGDAFSENLTKELDKTSGQTGSTDDDGDSQQAGPVGQGDYVVRDGDSIPSIAKDHGFFWETLWNDPNNEELKTVRKNPNVLLAGDRVTIREKERKDESLAAEKRHRFRRKGEPAQLNVCLKVAGEPIANTAYKLEIDGEPYPDGTTDAAGNVSVPIPGNAQKATLTVGEGEEASEYVFQIGGTKPVSQLAGVQQRLYNLGFTPIELDGQLGMLTEKALRRFQAENGLPQTGKPDKTTVDLIESQHGS